MRKTILLAVVLLIALPVAAQKIGKPTKDGVEPTEEQTGLIREGIRLHDEKKYDEAISVYRKVLEESPNCVMALYEIALSHNAKGDLDTSLRYALNAAEYRSDLLPRIYMMIANIVDDRGDPDRAILIYEEAIRQSPNQAILRFNAAITYLKLGKSKQAKEQLKEAIELEFSYASPHFLLATHWAETGYKVPGVLAALRFLSLEASTGRSRSMAEMVAKAIDSGATVDKDSGHISITLNIDGPTDEGDFSTMELLLSMQNALRISGEDSGSKDLTREEHFIKSLDTFIGALDDDKKNRKTFSGRYYFDYLKEMKSKGHTEVVGYIILTQIGSSAALKWLGENKPRLDAFAVWAQGYEPRRK